MKGGSGSHHWWGFGVNRAMEGESGSLDCTSFWCRTGNFGAKRAMKQNRLPALRSFGAKLAMIKGGSGFLHYAALGQRKQRREGRAHFIAWFRCETGNEGSELLPLLRGFVAKRAMKGGSGSFHCVVLW